jgi:hypothetical protein
MPGAIAIADTTATGFCHASRAGSSKTFDHDAASSKRW